MIHKSEAGNEKGGSSSVIKLLQKISQNSQRNTCYEVVFSCVPAVFSKIVSSQVFIEFFEYLQNKCYVEHTWTAAVDKLDVFLK